MRSWIQGIVGLALLSLVVGCGSSEYNRGYAAGAEAFRKAMAATDPEKEEKVDASNAPEAIEDVLPPTESAEWLKGFQDAFRDEQRRSRKSNS